MKTNAKKRMLISSVAMLLVAMLALGTATYAWFTTSTVATAKNINLHTAKASTLQVAGNDLNNDKLKWGTTVDYNFNSLLRPVSADLALLTNTSTEKWYEATAAKQSAFNAEAGKASVVTNTTGCVFKNQLNIRNAGTVAVEDVTVTVSGFNNAKYSYARIALVEANGLGDDVAAKTSGAKFLAAKVDTDETFEAAKGLHKTTVSGATGNDLTLQAQTINVSPNSDGKLVFEVADKLDGKTVSGDNTTYDTLNFNLYIWFEGQDKDCFSDNPVDISDLTFEVSGTTVDQI